MFAQGKFKAKVIQVARRNYCEGGVAGNPPSVCQLLVAIVRSVSLISAMLWAFSPLATVITIVFTVIGPEIIIIIG